MGFAAKRSHVGGAAVVEVACIADKSGIHPTHFGALPPQCAVDCDWNMRFCDLLARLASKNPGKRLSMRLCWIRSPQQFAA